MKGFLISVLLLAHCVTAWALASDVRIAVNLVNTAGDTSDTLVISQPGSYYLTNNITGDPGKNGISVQADNVTLDLNGFALIAGGGGNFRGVDVPNVQSAFCIR